MFKKLVTAVVVLCVLGCSLLVAAEVRRQERDLRTLHDSLLALASGQAGVGVQVPDDIPAPVARYLAWALPGDRLIAVARLAQSGTLRTEPDSGNWMTFEAEHLAAATAPGFIWNARVSIAPLIHVRVRDALLAGRGSGQVALMSAFVVGGDEGTPEMNLGSLHRYLAEAVWYPTALLPSETLRWTPISDNRALATLKSGGLEVSLEFKFGPSGEVESIYTPGRWGTFDGGYRKVPWEGHFARYQLQHGVRVPMEGDVGWYLEGVWQAVWKGTVTRVTFDFAN